MNSTHFCEQCGATLAADARFCEACGKPVAPTAQPVPPAPSPTASAVSAEHPATSLAAPAATAPHPTNRGLMVGLAIVGVLVVLGCLAVGVFGFWFMQSKPSVSSQLPVGTPQVVLVPTNLAPPSAATTVRAPTSAPLAATTPTMPTVIPTTTAAQTPACPPTPVLPTGVLFSDDFASRQVSECNGWQFPNSDNSDGLWSPNAYTISIKKPNSGAMTGMEGPSRQYADFALEIEAQPLDDNVSVYGLIFRYSKSQDGAETYYRFALFPDGRYSLNKLAAGDWVRVVDYTASPLIKTGKNKNILGVIAQGSTFLLYINRTLVKTVTDDAIKGSGIVGITVGNATNVPAAATFSRVTVLTPDKAQSEWSGASSSTQPPAQPTSAVPPGLYVSALRLDPGPRRGVDIAFYPTFLNTTGGTQSYRVKVYVYRAENLRNSFGETSVGPITIPVGSTEQRAAGFWKLGGGGCEDFIARVGWIDDQNRITYFNAPGGGMFEYRFPMCQ